MFFKERQKLNALLDNVIHVIVKLGEVWIFIVFILAHILHLRTCDLVYGIIDKIQ